MFFLLLASQEKAIPLTLSIAFSIPWWHCPRGRRSWDQVFFFWLFIVHRAASTLLNLEPSNPQALGHDPLAIIP